MAARSLLAIVVALHACSRPPTPVEASASKTLKDLPLEMVVLPRSAIAVPGSDRLEIAIGEIARGRTTVSLTTRDGSALIDQVSMVPGDTATFSLGDDTYVLTLVSLNDVPFGQGSATFLVSAPASSAGLSEEAKIERLIEHVASLHGAIFIRNDDEHTAEDAAAHLRRKLERAGDRVTTAEQFVEQIASKSSLSGKPYRIRLPDGSTVLAGDYLRLILRQMDR